MGGDECTMGGLNCELSEIRGACTINSPFLLTPLSLHVTMLDLFQIRLFNHNTLNGLDQANKAYIFSKNVYFTFTLSLFACTKTY